MEKIVKKKVGFTCGVFDLFHVGHLNILKCAKRECEHLIVGVTTDERAEKRKGRRPVIPFVERLELIESIKYVDTAVALDTGKHEMWQRLKFDIIFVGDDWKGSAEWNDLERKFSAAGVIVRYLPYTKNTSSTLVRNIIEQRVIN
mgnify:CR=1 FL=1